MFFILNIFLFPGSAGDVDVTSRQLSPPLNRLSPSDACSDVSSPGAGISSPVTSSFENNLAAARIAGSSASQQSSGENILSYAILYGLVILVYHIAHFDTLLIN